MDANLDIVVNKMQRKHPSLLQTDDNNIIEFVDCNPLRKNCVFTNDRSSKDSVNYYQPPKSMSKDGIVFPHHQFASVLKEPTIMGLCNNLNDQQLASKPISIDSHRNLPSKLCVQEQKFSSDVHWNYGGDASSTLYSNQNNKQQLNTIEPETSEFQIAYSTSGISREEIRARRRLKVIDRRKKKKLEKQQQTQKQLVPEFELNNVSEEFPDLNVARNNKKKPRNNHCDNVIASESKSNIGSKLNKGIEKSWKPKVKDPIFIDIGQAIQNKPEKIKVVSRKVDPTAQRNVIKGNILDSDNPQQKKGKVRPNQQRKTTKLKKQILLERQIKCEEVNNEYLKMVSGITDCILKEGNACDEQFEGDTLPSASCLSDEINSLLSKCAILDSDCQSDCDNKYRINQHNFILESTKTIHSKKFREYCTNCITEEVITSVCALLEKLAYFQDRMYARDPIRAQAKRRYVAGINQAKKYLFVKKVKLLVIAPDLDKSPGEGGLDNIIDNFKSEADSQGVPYIFGPKRKRLANAVFKKAIVSCVAVLSYEGAEELFSRVLEVLNDAKIKYQALISPASSNIDTKAARDITDIKEFSKMETLVNDYISADAVTSTLLAALKEDLSPADRLLNAIHRTEWPKK